MDKEFESKKRPNSKYSLSYPDIASSKSEETGLTFHYNRERRLENAPDDVKNLYKEETKKIRLGLLGPLIADRPRRFLFIIIVLMCGVILALWLFGFLETTHILGGNEISITAASFEDTTIVVLRKSARNADAYTGTVDIAVTVPVRAEDENVPVFEHRIFFTLEREETYRFAVPFEAPEMLMILQSEIETIYVRFNPD